MASTRQTWLSMGQGLAVDGQGSRAGIMNVHVGPRWGGGSGPRVNSPGDRLRRLDVLHHRQRLCRLAPSPFDSAGH